MPVLDEAPTVDVTWEEAWLFLYEQDPPEQLKISIRAWQLRGHTEEQIKDALIIAATQEKVVYESKLAYMNGILRNVRQFSTGVQILVTKEDVDDNYDDYY